ncbi:F-actin-capping protein subunit alpha [Orobanche gracilis]
MDENLVKRLEAAVARMEALSAGGFRQGAAVDDESDAFAMDPSIVAFDDLISNHVRRVASAAEKIGGQVLDLSKIIAEAFNVQKELIVKINQTQKPDTAGFMEFLKPLNEVMAKASALAEGRRSDFFIHLKTGADSLSALAWIAYTGKDSGMNMPIAHVEESWQMAEFYCNKILVEYRNKDANHVEWAKSLKDLYLPGLRDYVKSHYPLGPVWSATGKIAASTPAKAPTSWAPPPPSASLSSSGTTQPSLSRPKEGMSAVFQEISSGKPVTADLRKVTDDMKTKNRADRSGVVPVSEKKGRTNLPAFSKTGPPKLELQMGRKWVGKVNNITVDKCTKIGVVFKDVVAACEIVNSSGVEVQCQGSAPTISVDNTSGCQLYLSKDALEASITTAKSSEINVLVPDSESDSDWVEQALPQQYVHVYKDGQFVTTPVSHSGA